MSLIDEFLPSYQFSERHQAAVRCGPGELLDIIQNFQPPRDEVSETAMFVRQLPAKTDALGGSLASAATFAIHLGKLHSTGSRRRQRNCRWAYREILASGLRVVRRQRPFRVSRLQSSENRKTGDRICCRATRRGHRSHHGDACLLSGPLLADNVLSLLAGHSAG